MIQIKDGVDVTELSRHIWNAVYKLNLVVYDPWHCHCVITSGLDGKHKIGSRHYVGMAVDLRRRDLDKTGAKMSELIIIMRDALGKDYDIVIHKTHFHVEYDPERISK